MVKINIRIYFFIGFIGTLNENFEIRFDKKTAAYGGCGATLMGQFWYFGGRYNAYNHGGNQV